PAGPAEGGRPGNAARACPASCPRHVGEAVADGIEHDVRMVTRLVLLLAVDELPLPDVDTPRVERELGIVIAAVDPPVRAAELLGHERLRALGGLLGGDS